MILYQANIDTAKDLAYPYELPLFEAILRRWLCKYFKTDNVAIWWHHGPDRIIDTTCHKEPRTWNIDFQKMRRECVEAMNRYQTYREPAQKIYEAVSNFIVCDIQVDCEDGKLVYKLVDRGMTVDRMTPEQFKDFLLRMAEVILRATL